MDSWPVFGAAGIAALFLNTTIAHILFKLFVAITGGVAKRAKKRIRKFAKKNPEWHLRVYRTPAGYRILVMHSTFDPNDEVTLDFFRELKSDPVYVQMCQRQRCFRARLSPKPWRIGIEARMKPRPGVWPINPERMPERKKWIDHYEKVAHKYASCRFEEKLGSSVVDAKAKYIQAIHDRNCNANKKLAIA
jgi:hypothetical protein